MNFRQFAFNNIRRNARNYMAYLFSSSFAVMAFFTYMMFIYHPEITSSDMGDFAKTIMQLASYVAFVFSFLFVLYSNSSFLKARQKEFGILTILGITKAQLNRLIFIENMIIGFISMIIGISSGLLLSKLFLLVGSKVMEMDRLLMYIPWKAVVITVSSFIGLYMLIFFVTTFYIRKGTIVGMLKGDQIPKKDPTSSIWLMLLSLFCYSGTFLFLRKDLEPQNIIIVLLLDMIATYLLYSQASVFLIGKWKKNRTYTWKGVRLIWISEMAYKLKDSARMFFMITMVLIMACTALASILSLSEKVEQTYRLRNFDFEYRFFSTQSKNTDVTEMEEKLRRAGLNFQKIQYDSISIDKVDKNTTKSLIAQKDYRKIATILDMPNIPLQGNEAIYIESPLTGKNEKIAPTFDTKKGEKLFIKKKITKSIALNMDYLVINDSVYERIKARTTNQMYFSKVLLYHIPTWSDELPKMNSTEAKLGMELMNWGFKLIDSKKAEGQLFSKAGTYIITKQGTNMMIFVGLFIAVIFSVFTASFLYFRLFVNLEQDKKFYHDLSKIGLSEREMSIASTIQITILFYVPFFVASLQTYIGFQLANQVNESDFTLFSPPSIAIGSFLLLQTIYFILIRTRFIHKLKEVMV